MQLIHTNWQAPEFYYHPDEDTIVLTALPKKPVIGSRSLKFKPSGSVIADWATHFKKKYGFPCGMGRLFIDKNHTSYSLNGDTLHLELKGEIVSEESFYFEKDFLIRTTGKNEITLYCIHKYFGDLCIRAEQRNLATTEPPLPHPNLLKKATQ